MKFGEKLREQRKARNLTQVELAETLGIARRTLISYETGTRYPHDRSVYSKFADFFSIDVNYFLTEDEEFLTEAAERFGRRGAAQAKSILEQTAAMFAGGELSDKDKAAFERDMKKLFLDSKERAREKFTPKKYKDKTKERKGT
jgi:transcriptional regulator with XRE-family HTH domain